ncbi:MAG TPA: cysteine desulfurase family protein [Candidatus Pacearchaeota archaeon]|nr:cysteine desulfurase family protein [Candidatus Pacearchaeota archaeon]
MAQKLIYFDHAATTYVDRRVAKAMEPCFSRIFGNAGSLHAYGRAAKLALDRAREQVAEVLGSQPAEIIFTGSGTESDNLAVLGVARAYAQQGQHLITTNIEHKAVYRPMEELAQDGFQVDFVPVNQQGLVSVDDIINQVNDQTTLISIIYANNEIGVIQPIAEIGRAVKKIRADRHRRGVETPLWLHTDACQAAGYLSLSVNELGVDLLTLNGSKIYGPKGVGALFVRSGIKLKPFVFGGDQEAGLRPGTENVPGSVGLAWALTLASHLRVEESQRQSELRDYFIGRLTQEIPGVVLNGHAQRRLPNNINVSVLGVEGEAMLLWLDKYGIAASTGSACDSQRLEPSHVILALGHPYEYAHGSLRLTLGRSSSKKEIDYFMKVFPGIVEKLRQMSPVKHE